MARLGSFVTNSNLHVARISVVHALRTGDGIVNVSAARTSRGTCGRGGARSIVLGACLGLRHLCDPARVEHDPLVSILNIARHSRYADPPASCGNSPARMDSSSNRAHAANVHITISTHPPVQPH